MESTKDQIKHPTATDGKPPVMPRCSSCSFWRDKGWDGDEGIAKCDNPIVIEQVLMMNDELIESLS